MEIEPDPSTPRYIRTVAGVGYTLVQQLVEEPDTKAEVSALRTILV